MRTPLIGFLFVFPKILYVCCTPLPLKVDLGQKGDIGKYREDDVHRINEANRIANLQIQAMHRVVQDPTLTEHRKILVNTFGKHYDIRAITGHVDQLRKGTVQVTDLRDKSMLQSELGKTRLAGKPDASVRFGPSYHGPKMTDGSRAGTLIHEASHALFATKDYFSKHDKRPIKNKSDAVKSSSISGYMNQYRFKELRADPQSKMHLNADSWKAFGHHALTGKPHPYLNEFEYHPQKAGSSKLPHRVRAKTAHANPQVSASSRGRSPRRGETHGRSRSAPVKGSSKRKSSTPARGRSPQRKH